MSVAERLFYGALAMNCLFASAVYCTIKPSRVSIAVLVVTSVAWPFLNGPLEGHVLLTLSADHGITVSDLLTVAGLALAGWQYRRLRR